MKFIRDDNSERVGLPDITSMIDVVFLLIIFFLTTSSLVQMTRVPLDLPEEKGQSIEESESPGPVINIEADGRIVVDSVEVDVQRVLAMVGVEIDRAGGVDDLDVLLRADPLRSRSRR